MTSASPVLSITDGTDSIDLLDPSGILLYDWVPAAPEPKSGGVWADSPLAEGRKLQYRQLGNVADAFEFKVRGSSQDDAIFKLQELRRLLEKAVSYWLSDEQNQPVYLEARAAYETNTRYAVIHDYRTPKDANPFTQPFFNCKNAVVDNFLLSIEHGIWQESAPGDATCVEISGEQEFAGAPVVVTGQPGQSSDDAEVVNDLAIFTTGNVNLMGNNSSFASCDSGVRFCNMAIPNGAVIQQAYLQLVSHDNYFGSSCNVRITGEDVDDAVTFTDLANYQARTRTTATVDWDNIPGYPKGSIFYSPEVSDIIQEIVNRAGWASGNDIVLFLDDNGSAPGGFRGFEPYEGLRGYLPATLVVIYTTIAGTTYGRAATCDAGEVFIANKHNRANLSHVYSYDASGPTWSANLIGAARPFAFLPATPAAGDIVYFGSNNAVDDSGPFNNLVFDISTIQTGCTSIIWEYYNGATWATLTVQDNTKSTQPFDRAGVRSVHWVQPSNWANVAVNGITGLWVRARVATVGAAPTPPSQDNRDIYSAIWPRVELVADQVGGDLPALARVLLTNKSDASGGSPDLRTNRAIMGTRSLSRGENFMAFINLSNEQNPAGFTVAVGANSAFNADKTTPTGTRGTYTSPASTAATKEVTITLSDTITPEYLGRFRAFLRYKYHTGAANAVSLRLITTPGGSGLARYSDYFWPQVNTDWQVADFGIVNIQPRSVSDEYGTVTFEIECQPDQAGRVVYFYDLVLIPIDEWATDAVDKSGLAARTGAIGAGDLLDIDSVTYPRKVDQAILRQVSDSRILGYFQNRQSGPAVLQANAAQRLWVFCMAYESGTEVSSWPSVCHTVQVYRVQRYLSARGRR